MSINTTARARSVNLGITLDGKAVYATPKGLKLGARGPVEPTQRILSETDRGNARRLRKALYRAGMVERAALRRIPG